MPIIPTLLSYPIFFLPMNHEGSSDKIKIQWQSFSWHAWKIFPIQYSATSFIFVMRISPKLKA